ncbi:MAG: TspO/MBR family protein [Bacteroidota bacterium]|uniref:TspO/MBR family protein n=1 Tax=Leeuwenhoekiella palythoae TaxID=573501 RepID=UPI000E8CF8AB|nr:TspO/MBR family protein [Leeuwenhoekiella palythoae]MEC7782966.1 TspO/MBR family protein [Bacteroidota bacterium]HAX16446.1 sensory protein TspO [Leeuwenhoekiella sp.]MEC8883974.1 TspO/MBR family protein [Bacteroidota bacterium]MEE3244573.1 TspO/MBR family protein [Bacteroidota bacterium]UBZ09187.1 tryptophan-rich sensory protein [Leeuwenhoekiella palythoae]|tara:strand:- start:2005 stop:2481 length:477 start_codon:yes stop_codon:yes gene_type:complete
MNTQKTFHILIPITVCLLVGFLSAIATQSSVLTWYPQLAKPVFTPPNWLFAPVWTVLYILMGIAAGLVWNKGYYHKWVKTALYHFGFQLILNAAWSIVFFGMHLVLPALLIIISLLILLLFTFKWFKVVKPEAAYLLFPYIIWVAYASALNFEIWRLN